MSTVIKKPVEAPWRTAKLYSVDFTTLYMLQRCKSLPVGGKRIVSAEVGRKWVRICLPVCNTKFCMRRQAWDISPARLADSFFVKDAT